MSKPENKGAESKVDANDVVKNGTIKVEIPDECGDNLWNEVLAQSANHTEVLGNPADTLPGQTAASKAN